MSDWALAAGGNLIEASPSGGQSNGPALTAGAANTKGSWVQLIASLTHDIELLHVHLVGPLTGNARYALDIGIGASGSELVVVPDLVAYGTVGWATVIPLRVPGGTRIAARLASTTASSTARVSLVACAASLLTPVGYQSWTHYGFASASTGGVLSTSSATINTKGAWVELTSSTTDPIEQIYVCIAGDATASQTASSAAVDIGVGASGSEVALLPDLVCLPQATSLIGAVLGPFPVSIPAGSRIAARHSTNTTSAAPSSRFLRLSVIGGT